MNVKDFIGIAVISTLLFPIILMGMLIATGVVHMELGLDSEAKEKAHYYLKRYRPKQDEAEVQNLKSLEALKKQESDLAFQQENLLRDQGRLEQLKSENAKLKEEVIEQRKQIEKLIGQSAEIKDRKIKALAELYGSMRPEEAAPILLTLDDKMVANIMEKIPEVRARSKIMGTLGALDVDRAAKISRLMTRVGDKENEGEQQG